jgi:hypothetical protein
LKELIEEIICFHPLALLGMGVADVIKWREQKDKDAA